MSWTSETNIKGPKGDKGDPGIQGPPGTSGTGTGNVTGPASAVADRIAVYNGTTGTVIKDGGKTIAELGGSAASGITVAPAGNIAATNVQAAIVELDNEKVAKAGDTMTGNLTINKSTPSLVLQKTASGQSNQVAGYNGANPRWVMFLGDTTTETGSGNTGSNLTLASYTDAGAPIGSGALVINRATGVTDFKATPTVNGVPIAASSGNVVGPASSVLNRIAVYGDTTGKLIADGGTLISALQPANQAVRYDAAQGLTANQTAQARANIWVTRRNFLINGAFQVNQGGYVSAAVLTSPAYGHDQWKAGASGGDYSFTQTTSGATITIAAGKSLIQPIEDVRVTGGGSYVLAWTGTAQARAGVNTLTPSGAYAASPLLITGQTDGTVMSVEFNTGTLGGVGLYEGTVAPPFQLPDYPSELALCKRYWQKMGGTAAADIMVGGYQLAGADINNTLSYPVEMRAVPTAVVVGTWTFINATVAAINGTGTRSVIIRVTATATGNTLTYTTNTTCFITLNARL